MKCIAHTNDFAKSVEIIDRHYISIYTAGQTDRMLELVAKFYEKDYILIK